MLPGNSFTSKLKHTGDRNIASYRGDFRFACVQDRGCRFWGTPHFADTRAFRSLDAGAKRHGGIWSMWGAGVCVFRGFGSGVYCCSGFLSFVVLFILSNRGTENRII